MKKYQIKVYNLDGTYFETINETSILNEVSFSSNVNGGVGQLSIQTDFPISDYKNWLGKYIKVVMFDTLHKAGKQIYYGFISQTIRQAESSKEYTTLVCLGINSLLNCILYANGNYSQTPSNMVNNILNYFRNYYSCITKGIFDTSDTVVQAYSWQNTNCFDIIKSVSEGSGSKFIVDGDGQLQFFKQGKTHLLHYGFDIEKLTITDSIESVVNHYVLARTGAQSTYTNTASQNTYGRKDKYEMNTALNSATTMNQYGNQYITDNKNPKEELSITLNTNYPFEDILPGDNITILNAGIELENKIINRIQYKPDKCILTIDKTDTLWNVIE